MDDGQRVRLDSIITREAHRLTWRKGDIPPLHLLDIHVRTAADYDQRLLEDEPGFNDARLKMMKAELETLVASRN
jgi:hypothetical protein